MPHLVCLATAPAGQDCEPFLRDHARLLEALSTWTLVVVAPEQTAASAAYRRTFDGFVSGGRGVPTGWSLPDVRCYLATRCAVDDQRLDGLSPSDLSRFRELRCRCDSTRLDSFYVQWLAEGEALLTRLGQISSSKRASAGRLEIHLLPHRYTQFGDLPGVDCCTGRVGFTRAGELQPLPCS